MPWGINCPARSSTSTDTLHNALPTGTTGNSCLSPAPNSYAAHTIVVSDGPYAFTHDVPAPRTSIHVSSPAIDIASIPVMHSRNPSGGRSRGSRRAALIHSCQCDPGVLTTVIASSRSTATNLSRSLRTAASGVTRHTPAPRFTKSSAMKKSVPGLAHCNRRSSGRNPYTSLSATIRFTTLPCSICTTFGSPVDPEVCTR